MKSLPDFIKICEVGPRDGLQNERVFLTIEQKLELIETAAEAGIKVIEIGSLSILKQYRRWLIQIRSLQDCTEKRALSTEG